VIFQRLVERAVAAGVDATVDVWEGMPHGFMGNVRALVAAGDALAAIGAFLSTRFLLAGFGTRGRRRPSDNGQLYALALVALIFEVDE
jgi:hypothetical protein